MKKSIVSMMLAVMITSLAACQTTTYKSNEASTSQTESESKQSVQNKLSSAEDLTAEHIIKATTPEEILKSKNIFSIKRLYEGTGDEMFEGTTVESRFSKNGDFYEMNDLTSYCDGYTTNAFYSTDPSDSTYYMSYTGGKEKADLENGYADEMIQNSLLGYTAKNLTLLDVTEENGKYIATINVAQSDSIQAKDIVTLDSKTGLILSVVSTYPSAKGSGDATCTTEFDYSENIKMDYTAKIENGGTVPEADSTQASSDQASAFQLDAEDINGKKVGQDTIKAAKLILLNYWEPWCGPCVKEMPDLQKLYDNYKEKGLVVLGVYSSFDMQSDAEDIVEGKNISYPILKSNASLEKLAQDYYPATYFIDGNGSILTSNPYAGARSYEEWEEIVKNYLGE